MSPRRLLPFLVALLAGKLALDHISDPDLFWHLRLGLDMLAERQLPRESAHSWTLAAQSYLANDWLAQVLMAAVYRVGDIPLLSVAKSLSAAVLGLVLYAASLERAAGHASAAAIGAAAGIFIAATNFATRPVLLGMLCCAGVLFACERIARRADGYSLAALPVLFALWLNIHGSWPVGLVMVGALSLSGVSWRAPWLHSRITTASSRRAAVAAFPLALLGLSANPVGVALWGRPLQLLRAPGLDVFDEWAPVPTTDPSFWLLVATGALLAWLVWRARAIRPPPLIDLAVVAGAGVMALTSAHYHFVYGLLLAPSLADCLSQRVPTTVLRHRTLNLAVGGLALVALLPIAAHRVVTWREDVARRIPVAAIAELEQSAFVKERGFNYFDWGGYLVFKRIPSFIDGRLEPFIKVGIFDQYLAVEQQGNVAELERLGVRWALVKRGTRLANALGASAAWRMVYRDHLAELWAL